MAISEAVQLIIQAGTIGLKGEIFVLDMGNPVKIVALARELIRLSGHREEDIEIRYIGLRPGEKLYEEVLVDEEKAKATEFEKIFIAPPLESDTAAFQDCLQALLAAAEAGDEAKVIGQLQGLGIGFHHSAPPKGGVRAAEPAPPGA
jgi:FlaA1/EpsC-like NDP-sugar epimerase